MLWTEQRLTGVIDWSACRLGPRWFELAYCRADVVLLQGLPTAQRLTRVYSDIAGAEPVDLPVLDLICGLLAHAEVQLRLFAYREQGYADNEQLATARLCAFLQHGLAELGA